jgi:hypothetical protein
MIILFQRLKIKPCIHIRILLLRPCPKDFQQWLCGAFPEKIKNILNAAQKASVEYVKYERTEIALGYKKNTVGREYTRPTVNKCFLLSSVSAWG